MSNKRAGLPLGSLVSTWHAASPSRSACRPSVVGFSCARVVLAHSLASIGARGSTTYDISVSPSDSVVPE
eukprot:5384894-Alexandrium_andersonii.AAC.1